MAMKMRNGLQREVQASLASLASMTSMQMRWAIPMSFPASSRRPLSVPHRNPMWEWMKWRQIHPPRYKPASGWRVGSMRVAGTIPPTLDGVAVEECRTKVCNTRGNPPLLAYLPPPFPAHPRWKVIGHLRIRVLLFIFVCVCVCVCVAAFSGGFK